MGVWTLGIFGKRVQKKIGLLRPTKLDSWTLKTKKQWTLGLFDKNRVDSWTLKGPKEGG